VLTPQMRGCGDAAARVFWLSRGVSWRRAVYLHLIWLHTSFVSASLLWHSSLLSLQDDSGLGFCLILVVSVLIIQRLILLISKTDAWVF
jgi:hypothetical protein